MQQCNYLFSRKALNYGRPFVSLSINKLCLLNSCRENARHGVTASATAQIVASLPNLSYKSKAWSEYSLCISLLTFFDTLSFYCYIKTIHSFLRHSLRHCFINYSQIWSIRIMKHELELITSFLLF